MNEQEITRAIHAIADNHERGMHTNPSTISPQLREAIARLYKTAYDRGHREGEKYGRDTLTMEAKHELRKEVNAELKAEYESKYAAFAEDCERLREQRNAYAEQVLRAEERHAAAVKMLRDTIGWLECEKNIRP